MNDDVIFNADEFRKQYPNIKATDEQLELSFDMATMHLNNDKTKGVRIPTKKRKILMYLLVAHFATLLERLNNGNESVGKLTSATQGSVSVSFNAGDVSSGKVFFQQTQYGNMFLAATQPYRSFLYVIGSAPMPVRRQRLRY